MSINATFSTRARAGRPGGYRGGAGSLEGSVADGGPLAELDGSGEDAATPLRFGDKSSWAYVDWCVGDGDICDRG